jgi:NADP-dependent 3-hydroxy acid dehydrogenase YdfG
MENRKMAENQRVAVVTDAAGGIGRAMVRGLLSGGIRVAGADRDQEPLEALAARAREQGNAADLLTVQIDLTNDSAAEEITKATRDRFGRIDILINDAGIGPGTESLETTTPEAASHGGRRPWKRGSSAR